MRRARCSVDCLARRCDAVRQVAADDFDIQPDQVEIGGPEPLNPSSCVAVPVWRAEVLDASVIWYTQLDDGTLVRGGDDATLARVSKACFLDHDTVPEPDAAQTLVLRVGPSTMSEPLDATTGPAALDSYDEDWEPPSVTPTDDGFDVSLFAEEIEIFKVYHVTSSITPDSATTEYRPLT